MSKFKLKTRNGRLLSIGLKTGLVVICMMITFQSIAQTIDDPADGDGLVPLDGGVTILMAAAAGLGAYRTAKRR